MRQAGGFEDGRRDVDDVMELAAHLALGLDPVRPVHDRPVARAAPVRRNLLCPLIGRIHRVRPAHRVVVVGVRSTEEVDLRLQELGGLERAQAVEDRHLVEAAVRRALSRRAVVADDQVDERVVEDLQILERVDEPAEMVVGVLEKRRVDFHLAGEDRPHVLRRLVPGRNFVRPRRENGVGRDDAQLLLARERFLAQLVPALVELALVLLDPVLRHVVRRVAGARREIHEERLVGHQRLLLARPLDRLVRHVFGEVVALFRGFLGLDWDRAFVDRRVPLVGLAADEAVEVLEAAAAGWPLIERPHRAGFPDGHFMALAELRRRVAIELERHGERRLVLRQHRRVAWSRGRDFADAAHVDGVVIAPGQEGLPRGRAQRRRVEAIELEPVLGQALRRGRMDRAAERARRGKADVVEEHDEHIRCALRRQQPFDRRELRVRILRVVRGHAHVLLVGNGKNRSLNPVLCAHPVSPHTMRFGSGLAPWTAALEL